MSDHWIGWILFGAGVWALWHFAGQARDRAPVEPREPVPGEEELTEQEADDVQQLTLTLVGEASLLEACPELVAWVIMQRAGHWNRVRYGGPTVRGVVRKPDQFEAWDHPDTRRTIEEVKRGEHPELYRRLRRVAYQVYTANWAMSPIPGVLHFIEPQRTRARMDPATRRVTEVYGRRDHWAVGARVHEASDACLHWFLEDVD